MRDPKRIDEMLELVRQVWTKNPDLRLGQIIVGAVGSGDGSEVFYIEDAELRSRLEAYRKRIES